MKTIVCLANSRKHSGRCVAGILDDGSRRWVRPVSTRPTREVSEYERRYEDGSDPRILDIIDVPLLRPLPQGFQTENWTFDPDLYWKKLARAGWSKLITFEQRPATLWINGSSTLHGTNDRLPIGQADSLRDSLKLIRVEHTTLHVHAPGAGTTTRSGS